MSGPSPPVKFKSGHPTAQGAETETADIGNKAERFDTGELLNSNAFGDTFGSNNKNGGKLVLN